MFTFNKFLYSATLGVLVIICVKATLSEESHKIRHTRSPAVEVLMHLPPNFHNVEEFKSFLGLKPERRRRETPTHIRLRRDVSSSDSIEKENDESPLVETPEVPRRIARDAAPSESLVGSPDGPEELPKSLQKEALIPNSAVVDSSQLIVEPVEYPTTLELRRYPNDILQLVEQGPTYVAQSDPEDPRKRRNTSANDHEDKRSYPEPGSGIDGTTSSPYRKYKSSNPPFITAREGRQNYDQVQHRGNENARESHSMKDGKSMSSNEIPRMSDSYYSATSQNSRAYNPRQSESTPPKSVYDSIDYTSRRAQGRNIDSRSRLTYDDYNNYNARPYDRYYYPYGGEVAGRGIEYYHRSMDPSTGRTVYYASLPEPDVYRASRTYTYDPYSRALPPPYPYQPYPYNPYNPYSSYQPYVFQDFSRSARYQQSPLPTYDRYDDPRNKTYVIYDAEEKRSLSAYPTKSTIDRNRYAPPLPYPSFPSPVTYPSYQPYPVYTPYRSPSTSYRSNYQDSKSLMRQVELPLTSRSTLKQVTV